MLKTLFFIAVRAKLLGFIHGSYAGTKVYTLLYMNRLGWRFFKVIGGDGYTRRTIQKEYMADVLLWKKGGPFPSKFIAMDEDYLGHFLADIVQRRMTGEK